MWTSIVNIASAIIPAWWKYGLLCLLAAALWGHGWTTGAAHVREAWERDRVVQETRVAIEQARRATVTAKVVTKYRDRVRVIRERGADIIKEVPVYVTQANDADCRNLSGFVRLLNDAAGNPVAPAP